MFSIDENSVITQFENFMNTSGIKPHGRITVNADGKIHRFCLEGDSLGTKNGAYCLYLDGRPSGFVKNWKTGETLKFKYELGADERREFAKSQSNPEQRKQVEIQRKEAERRKAQDLILQREKERRLQAKAWNEYQNASDGLLTEFHPYILNRFNHKGIFLEDGLFSTLYAENNSTIWRMPARICNKPIAGGSCKEGDLLIPFIDIHSWSFKTLQRIPYTPNEKGKFDKRFFSGISLIASAHVLMPDDIDTSYSLLVCEGFATGLAVVHLTHGKNPVFCAGGCGNLIHVCKALRERTRERKKSRKIIIMADNDKSNAGQSHAQTCVNEGFADDIKIAPITGGDWYDFLLEITTRKTR